MTETPRHNNNKKEKQNKKNGPFYRGQSLLSMRPVLEYGRYTTLTALEKLLSQQVSAAVSLLLRGGTLCPLPLISAVSVSDLSLCRSYECCHSLCGFIFPSVLLYLKTLFLGTIYYLWLLESFYVPFYKDP